MAITLARALKPVFNLSAEAFPRLAAERFGPQDDMDQTWLTFEPVANTLVNSFYLTLDEPNHARLAEKLDAVKPELRGIAYEGAGMGLMLLDCLLPHKQRLAAFLQGPGASYRCLVYIGAGLVLPRVPVNVNRFLRRQDPFYQWLVMDGYGFYEGFFSWKKAVEKQAVSRRVQGYGRRAFDQGLGRSLWFSTGANVERIITTINGFPASRRPDLWSGVGVACAYAAGVMDRSAITTLLEASGDEASHFAVGTAVASIFREQSELTAPHTDLACDVVWGQNAEDVAALAHKATWASALPHQEPSYEGWREHIRHTWLREHAHTWNTKELSA